jgi:hypothetical protein
VEQNALCLLFVYVCVYLFYNFLFFFFFFFSSFNGACRKVCPTNYHRASSPSADGNYHCTPKSCTDRIPYGNNKSESCHLPEDGSVDVCFYLEDKEGRKCVEECPNLFYEKKSMNFL